MRYSLACGAQTGTPETAGVTAPAFGGTVLQTMIDILNQPRVRRCLHCHGKGLVSPRAVCPCCQGYGRTP